MNTKWLTNPFFVYSLSFLLVFSIYQLRWSDRYPPLSAGLIVFLFATFIISFFLAFVHEKHKINEFSKIEISKKRITVLILVYMGFVLEFIYFGGVPILSAISNPDFNYKDFTGIPTFHVILGTFSLFYSVYLFHQYISADNDFWGLILFLISIFPNILVVNRGAIIIIIFACFVIYLMKIQRLRLKKIGLIIFSIAALIYAFGIIGNLRYSASKEDKEYILRIGGASDEFIQGDVPFEYYWGYLYIATPIGNMQNIINKKESRFVTGNVSSFIAGELFPDFISKRLVTMLGVEDFSDDASKYFVIEVLNAPTVYYRSYYLLGWTGAVLMFVYSIAIMLFYPYLIPRSSKYFITGWACLVSIVLLNIFSNMWYASGTLLIWPLIANLFTRIRIYKNNNIRTGNIIKL
ncbi:O-antigen polymerase [Mucilaginibacter flavidus]|uniref:O-antigen polymerase n=1 Tax=Mucilaginibacter flavidus TaxID=2949309 RepID=UPI002092735A|nr:O-antigen polymerase [Mucilaginibacter flavidus]MCO5947242.1 oligosaccharide repeat unit polymerase [Mucilaginibacter flavidus]